MTVNKWERSCGDRRQSPAGRGLWLDDRWKGCRRSSLQRSRWCFLPLRGSSVFELTSQYFLFHLCLSFIFAISCFPQIEKRFYKQNDFISHADGWILFSSFVLLIFPPFLLGVTEDILYVNKVNMWTAIVWRPTRIGWGSISPFDSSPDLMLSLS